MDKENFYKKIFEEIKNKAADYEKFDIPDLGIYTTLWVAALVFEVCIGLAILGVNSSENMTILMVFLFSITVMAIICTIAFPIFFIYKNKLLAYKTAIDNSILSEQVEQINNVSKKCEDCINIKKGTIINAYNLITYDQILQIEKRLGRMEGDERAVFSYSMYREDGPGVGIDAANDVVADNNRAGVPYYILFYKEVNESIKLERPVLQIDKCLFINLTEVLGDKLNENLDYQFYKQTFFDIMLYKYSKEKIEGYYCLSFPIAQDCQYRKKCSLDCRNGTTDKVFYKKMPKDIAEDLYKKLFDLATNCKDRYKDNVDGE